VTRVETPLVFPHVLGRVAAVAFEVILADAEHGTDFNDGFQHRLAGDFQIRVHDDSTGKRFQLTMDSPSAVVHARMPGTTPDFCGTAGFRRNQR
jgi:hypothetical protein